MLNRLSLRYDFLPALVPDGVFGERTLEAVMLFQRELHPPVTGVVDRETWQAILDEWLDLERELADPRQIRAFPPVLKFRPVPPTTTFSRYRPCFRASPMSWMAGAGVHRRHPRCCFGPEYPVAPGEGYAAPDW